MFKGIEKEGEEEYLKFWNNFGKYLKVGIIEDNDNKKALAQLCRFWTTESGEDFRSLDTYVANMKPNQTDIYYVTGDSKLSASRSPVLEKLRAKNIEVVYLTEPLDELTFQTLEKFGDFSLTDAAKGDLKLPEDEAEKSKKEEATKDLEDVCAWLENELTGKVQKVVVSTMLTESPAALVQGAYGMSPTMQRYMRAQAVASGQEEMLNMNMNQATMEINPDHQVVQQLKSMVGASPSAKETKLFGALMYDVAALAGGYTIEDTSSFAARVTGLMTSGAIPTPEPEPISEEPTEEVAAEIVVD